MRGPENHAADTTPFPGMDPWLEHPAIAPDVHNSLVTAVRDELVPRIAPDRILVSRGATRPRARLFTFNVRQLTPGIPIPLLPQDVEREQDLRALVHALYNRARFDLRLNYSRPPVPPLSKAKMDWARTITESGRSD
ncbi:MAG: DUF4058 family protein [Isosphaeraceae bacterium]